MIELKDIKKIYDKSKKHAVKALDGISLLLPDTGMVFVVGRSGGGKSTLLNILGGLDTFDEGDFLIDGVSAKDFSEANWDSYRNRYVGFVFQDKHLMNDYNVKQNIEFALALQYEKLSDTDKDEKIRAALKSVDLEGFEERRIKKLSGGQRQRVAIARALVKDYQMILADEPTGNLDAQSAKDVFDLLKCISKTKLVVVITHDVEAANRYADLAVAIRNGKLTERSASPDFAQFIEPQRLGGGDSAELHSGLPVKAGQTNAVAQIKEFTQVHEQKKKFAFITSNLSAKATWRIIGKSFKKRAVRLFFSAVLCVIAFSLIASVFKIFTWTPQESFVGLIEHDGGCIVGKLGFEAYENGGGSWFNAPLEDADISWVGAEVSRPLYRVENVRYVHNRYKLDEFQFQSYYTDNVFGACQIDEQGIKALSFELVAGEYPGEEWGEDDVAISKYAFDMYRFCGYKAENNQSKEIVDYEDLLGETITYQRDGRYQTAIIRGIIDTHDDAAYQEEKKYVWNMADKGTNPLVSHKVSEYFGEANFHTLVYKKISSAPIETVFLVYPSSHEENNAFVKRIEGSQDYSIRGQFAGDIRENMQNKSLSAKPLVIGGLIVAAFAIFLLASFTVACVREARAEIGILRCVGASKKDIFRIYTLEVFLIFALIFSLTLTAFILFFIPNLALYNLVFLTFPFPMYSLQIIDVLFLIALIGAVSAASCFLPLWHVTKKAPVRILSDM